MKKLITLIALVTIGVTAQAQTTTILKQEVDTVVINTIFSQYALDIKTGERLVAKNEKQKKEFVNDMILGYLRQLVRESAGNRAADEARKLKESTLEFIILKKVD